MELELEITKLKMRRLRLLGPAGVDLTQKAQNRMVESEVAGGAVDAPRFRSRRTVALLGYLVAEQRSVTRDFLTALFWPDETSTKGRANLRRELHNLTQILPGCWELDRQTVKFVPSADTTVDLYQLQGLEAGERWWEASELLGGEFLEGLYLDDNLEFENWLLAEREYWRGRAEVILTRVIDGHVQRGRYSDALHNTRRLLQLIPWNEEAHRQTMRLLAWTGQRGSALRQFKACKQVLNDELEVEPASETIALYQEIQAGKLDLPPQLPVFLTQEKPRRKFEQPLFVGRESELVRLDAFLKGALTGESRVVFVTGGPGLGKTALLIAFVREALDVYPNLLVASGKGTAYSGMGDPYLTFRDVMRMLTGDVEAMWDAGTISRNHAQRLWAALSLIVQALLDHGSNLLDIFIPGRALLQRSIAAGLDHEPWLPRLRENIKRVRTSSDLLDQSHLFQQVTDVLHNVAQMQPLLLILDDFQWADVASISLLFHLGRRFVNLNSKILIVCAYRPEEVAIEHSGERHPLAKPLKEFKQVFGDVWVDLDPAEAANGQVFVEAILDSMPNLLDDEFKNALYRRTEGHPLFTVELLRAMQERGDLQKDDAGYWVEGPKLDWELLPARVEAVIEERVSRLDPELQELLTIASVEGEIFTAQVVANVLNMPERYVLHRLSQELEQEHRLIREQEEIETGQKRVSRYRFSHILFQDYLYKHTNRAEQRLLHREIARILEKLYDEQLDEMSVQLAHHFYWAGEYKKAFRYYSMAAERAAHFYDSGEAIIHYTRAIGLSDAFSPDTFALATLYRGRGLAYERLGMFDQAHADHKTILQISQTAGDHKMAWRAYLDLGKLWASRDYDQARANLEVALELAHEMDDPAIFARSLNRMGNWYVNDENPLRAIEYHLDALKIAEQVEDRRDLANTLDLLGIAHLLHGNLSASIKYYDRAITQYRELDELPGLASSLIGRATNVSVLAWLVSYPVPSSLDAISDFDEALRIAKENGLVVDQAWAYYSLGMLYMVQGFYRQALENIQSGLRIASKIGHREYVVGARFALGMLYAELFTPDQARRQFEEALTLARDLRSPAWIHPVSAGLAGMYLVLNEDLSACSCLETAISDQTPMDTLGKRYCWARQAELALARGEPTLALDIVERLIASTPGISPGQVVTFLWKLKGEALAAIGYKEDALSQLQAALENAKAAKERFLLWQIHATLGRLYHSTGDQQAAKKEIASAHAVIDELAGTIPDETLTTNFRKGTYRILET